MEKPIKPTHVRTTYFVPRTVAEQFKQVYEDMVKDYRDSNIKIPLRAFHEQLLMEFVRNPSLREDIVKNWTHRFYDLAFQDDQAIGVGREISDQYLDALYSRVPNYIKGTTLIFTTALFLYFNQNKGLQNRVLYFAEQEFCKDDGMNPEPIAALKV